jgi:hypothetical protein
MGLYHSPRIVTNGLVLALDAADRNSYVSGSTTWYNLAGSNNGTLTNGPTYNSANGGSIVFDGTNDYAAMSGNTFGYSPGTTGELSLETWVYVTGPFSTYLPDNLTAIGGIVGQGIYNGTTGWGLGITRVGTGSFQYDFQTRNVSIASITAPANFTTGSWNHVVGSFTRNDFSRIYLNGNLAGSASSTPYNGVTLTPNFNDASLGKAGGQPFYAGCRIAICRLYNRPLSADEIQQNFNALRGRFGI